MALESSPASLPCFFVLSRDMGQRGGGRSGTVAGAPLAFGQRLGRTARSVATMVERCRAQYHVRTVGLFVMVGGGVGGVGECVVGVGVRQVECRGVGLMVVSCDGGWV